MATSPDNIFTHEDKQRIDEALLNIDNCEKLIQRAKIAGLDVSEQEQRCRDTRKKLNQLKQGFFPNG